MNLIALVIKHKYQAIFLHPNLNLKLLFCNIRFIERTLIRGEGTLYNIIDVMNKVKGRAHIRTQLRNRLDCA